VSTRQAEHELAHHPTGFRILGDEHQGVAIRIDPPLLDALFELGARLVEAHRLPDEVAADVLPTEQIVDRFEIAGVVRPKIQPSRSNRVRELEHSGTISGVSPGLLNGRECLSEIGGMRPSICIAP
jgi:hypothetical protein